MLAHSEVIVRAPDHNLPGAFRGLPDGKGIAASNSLDLDEHAVALLLAEPRKCRGKEVAVARRSHVRPVAWLLREIVAFGHQTDHGAIVCLVVTAAFVGRGASEIRRELRWPVRYDHSHCD
jgi:hypothetical protein